mgnify:CR=1 FL=1
MVQKQSLRKIIPKLYLILLSFIKYIYFLFLFFAFILSSLLLTERIIKKYERAKKAIAANK